MNSGAEVNPSGDLAAALAELENEIRATGVSREHFIPDLVALGLARDVFENARAVQELAESPVPRAVYPNARAAFEAAQDLILLVGRPEYDRWGARALVAEMYDKARSRELAQAVFDELGQPGEIEQVDVDALVDDAAAAWEQYAPGKGELVIRAREEVEAARERHPRRYHWSGLTRDQINREIVPLVGGGAGTGEIYRSWYNLLSFQTHPSPRIDDTHLDWDPETGFTLVITPDEDTDLGEMGRDAAYVAVQSAALALKEVRRLRENGVD